MPITGENPLVIPEKVYDKYWMNLRTRSAGPNKTVKVDITLTPYIEIDEYGAVEIGPKIIKFSVDDLFLEASNNPELASALNSLFSCVQNISRERGLI